MTLTVQPLGRKRTFTDHLGIPKENMICRGCSKDKTAVTPSEATNQQRTGDVDRTFSPAQRLLAKLRRSFAVKGSESPHASTEFTTSVHTARNHDSINNRSTDELCQACAKRKQHLRRSFHGRASDPWVPSGTELSRSGSTRLHTTREYRVSKNASLRRLFEDKDRAPATPAYDEILEQHLNIDKELEKLRRATENKLPELSDEQLQDVQSALCNRSANAILSKGFKLEIKTGDIRTLRDGAWLNDEVINFYGELIMDRAIRNSEKHPPVHCFNTHFYPTVKNGYQSVRRWTRRVDLFSKDLIIVPVHLGNHWTCAVINFRRKRFEYYDSLHGTNTKVFPLLRSYITQESLDKRKQPLSLEGWTNYAPTDIPFQLNGNDCGVFTCVFMEYSARQAPFDFDGNHMSYFRQRIICEILEKKLLVE